MSADSTGTEERVHECVVDVFIRLFLSCGDRKGKRERERECIGVCSCGKQMGLVAGNGMAGVWLWWGGAVVAGAVPVSFPM